MATKQDEININLIKIKIYMRRIVWSVRFFWYRIWNNRFNIFVKFSAVNSIHQPQFKVFNSSQGVPSVVITGKPTAKASATTIPKFSLYVGNIIRSALLKKSHFSSPNCGPTKFTFFPYFFSKIQSKIDQLDVNFPTFYPKFRYHPLYANLKKKF